MFTQSCFIRKNTPELRGRLGELGYFMEVSLETGTPYLYCSRYGEFACMGDMVLKLMHKSMYVDCGTNEELFLAIAALRDDSDYMQWFVDKDGKWFLCQREKISRFIDLAAISGYDVSDLRKATVKELINHFKK